MDVCRQAMSAAALAVGEAMDVSSGIERLRSGQHR